MATDIQDIFQLVEISSDEPRLRGRAFGEAARDRIHESRRAYEETFLHFTGLGWSEVTKLALEFAEPIRRYDEAILEEIEGIAEGAGLGRGDLLAINARTEIMFGLKVKPAPECTTFFTGPSVTADGHVYLGQNWDWRPRAKDSIVLVEIDQGPEPPAIFFMPEAGLIGKAGFNQCGLGVTLNAMMSGIDKGELGVPTHVIMRAILNSRTIEEAVGAIIRAHRSGSATYTLASATGVGICLETAPGGVESVFMLHPEDDVLAHSNHFVAETPFVDPAKAELPDTLARLERMDSLVTSRTGEISPDVLTGILADDENHPNAICRFPDPDVDPILQVSTVASIVMDLTAKSCQIAAGPPSEHLFSQYTPTFA